jgi:hypothetical protein
MKSIAWLVIKALISATTRENSISPLVSKEMFSARAFTSSEKLNDRNEYIKATIRARVVK